MQGGQGKMSNVALDRTDGIKCSQGWPIKETSLGRKEGNVTSRFLLLTWSIRGTGLERTRGGGLVIKAIEIVQVGVA